MRVTEQELDGWCFCQTYIRQPGMRGKGLPCEGYEPFAPVRVVKTTTAMLFGDYTGGSGATDVDLLMADMTSHESTVVRFADPEDARCPFCEQMSRVATLEPAHPAYDALSGQDPLRLLALTQDDIRRAMQQQQQSSVDAVELANLRRELAEMRVEMMQMVLEARTGNGAPAQSEPLSGPEDAETTTDTPEARTAAPPRRGAASRGR